jgi:hypothetical protein
MWQPGSTPRHPTPSIVTVEPVRSTFPDDDPGLNSLSSRTVFSMLLFALLWAARSDAPNDATIQRNLNKMALAEKAGETAQLFAEIALQNGLIVKHALFYPSRRTVH